MSFQPGPQIIYQVHFERNNVIDMEILINHSMDK